MDIETARASVGKRVKIHIDFGQRDCLDDRPQVVKQVTKGGMVILEGYPHHRFRPSQIEFWDDWNLRRIASLIQ